MIFVIGLLGFAIGFLICAAASANKIDDAFWDGFETALDMIEDGNRDEAKRFSKAFGRD